MNTKTFVNPQNRNDIRTTRDPDTARSLRAQGWREVEARVTPKGEGAKNGNTTPSRQ